MKIMIPEKMREILRHEGVVSIVTQASEVHVVNTWNSYIKITDEGNILIPAGRMNTTEENIRKNKRVLMTLGSREVDGLHSKGAGFLVEGIGEFLYKGKDYDIMKKDFPWIRATLTIKADKITQTL